MLEESIDTTDKYIHVAALCAILWDIIIHISEDSEILVGSKLSLASSVFLISRISTLGQAIASILFSFGTNLPCESVLAAEISLLAISICSTTLLFFFRARAVFFASRTATVFFFILWIIAAGNCIAQPLTYTAVKSAWNEGCRIEEIKMSSTTCAIATVTNDIIVFTLISWKILSSFVMEEGYGSCFAYFCGKDGLPVISHILLRTGQQYFIFTVAVKVVGTVVMHAQVMPMTLSVSFLVPLVVLENAMGCKVFRDIKLDFAVRNGSLPGIPSRPIEFIEGTLRDMERTSLLAV